MPHGMAETPHGVESFFLFFFSGHIVARTGLTWAGMTKMQQHRSFDMSAMVTLCYANILTRFGLI